MSKKTQPVGLRAALAAQKPRSEQVTLDGVAEPVTITAPSLAHRMLIGEVYQSLKDKPAEANHRGNAVGVCAALRDSDGNLVYDPKDPDDVDAVMNLAPHILEALIAALGRVNGYAAKQAETAEKNSRTSRKE